MPIDRVVWVTLVAPDHEGTGAQLRQAHLLDAVARHRPVHLVAAAAVRDPRIRNVASVIEVPTAAMPTLAHPIRRRARLARHVLTERLPFETAVTARHRRILATVLDTILQPGDVVVVEHLELAPLVFPRRDPQRRVLTIHHASARQARQQAHLSVTARQRWWWGLQAQRATRLELFAGTAFDTVVTVSDLDATEVACPSVVVANGVEIGPDPSSAPGTHDVVFTGSLTYGPNIDGITWFVDACWPRVRQRIPDARLRIVGRQPTPQVQALDGRDGVSVHPDVDRIGPWIEGGDVAVVPLRLGGGTRLKALQALAAGRPVVGTTIGLEGLGLADGQQVRIADEPHELADAVADVLTDPLQAHTLAVAGRAHVVQRHDWREIGERFALDVLGLTGAAT